VLVAAGSDVSGIVDKRSRFDVADHHWYTSSQTNSRAWTTKSVLYTDTSFMSLHKTVLPARSYASVVLALFTCLSARLSQTGIVSKRLHGSSWFLHTDFPRLTLCSK